MPTSSSLRAQDYLTEDPMVLPWGKLVKILRGQVPWPIAALLATVLKITKMLGGGSAINAGARDSHPVDYSEIPLLGRAAFEGLKNQLPDFEFIQYANRDMVGMRQEYSALAVHRDHRTVALCQWQQHLIVLPADKMADERDKSSEALTTEFVSFEGDRPVVTSCVPKEHMGASDLYDEGLGDIVLRSNEQRLEQILTEHLSRISRKSVDAMDPDVAIHRAKHYGYRVRDHFIELGLVRCITEKELEKILAEQERHADRFAKYTAVKD